MSNQSDEDIRNSIIGLGEKSVQKSYYPQLQRKMREIEELNKNLEKKVKERTKELSEQKEVFESLFYDSSDSLALLKDGRFIDCNNALLNHLGYKSKEDFLNIRPYEVSPEFQPDDKPSKEKELLMIAKCIKEGKNNFEWVHKKQNGELFWVDVSLTKIVLNDEIHVHVAWRDITEKKQLSDKLQKRKEELEDLNEELNALVDNLEKTQDKLVESGKMASLGGLVAGVAHEIHKPVDVAVTGLSYLIHTMGEMKEEFSKNNKLLNYLNSSEGLLKIIDDNLNQVTTLVGKFKQISVEQKNEIRRTIDLKDYIYGIILSLQTKLTDKNIKVDLNCDEELTIESYPEDFNLIFTNLITNSIEHGFLDKFDAKIDIKLLAEDNYLKILYSNNGESIKDEHLSKIFDPFFTTSENDENPGLGLNIVYNTVSNKLHGEIKCENKKTQGVLFTITIPIT